MKHESVWITYLASFGEGFHAFSTAAILHDELGVSQVLLIAQIVVHMRKQLLMLSNATLMRRKFVSLDFLTLSGLSLAQIQVRLARIL
jgi:hypothetical protein